MASISPVAIAMVGAGAIALFALSSKRTSLPVLTDPVPPSAPPDTPSTTPVTTTPVTTTPVTPITTTPITTTPVSEPSFYDLLKAAQEAQAAKDAAAAQAAKDAAAQAAKDAAATAAAQSCPSGFRLVGDGSACFGNLWDETQGYCSLWGNPEMVKCSSITANAKLLAATQCPPGGDWRRWGDGSACMYTDSFGATKTCTLWGNPEMTSCRVYDPSAPGDILSQF